MRMWISRGTCVASITIGSLFASPAYADSISYSYDALGRLVEVFDSNTGYRGKYAFDTANNHSNVEARDVVIRLNANQSIYSPDGRFQLIMQTDGNLVVYGPSELH